MLRPVHRPLPVCVGRRVRLPVEGHAIREVTSARPLGLRFDDAELEIFGDLRLFAADGQVEHLEPGRETLRRIEPLVGVRIVAAGADRYGRLVLGFEHGAALEVPDGPFENWSYTGTNGARIIGGVGRVIEFGG